MADAGWYPDPYQRYSIRWFDGQQWTAHVQEGNSVVIDPLGSGYASQPVSQSSPGGSSAAGQAMQQEQQPTTQPQPEQQPDIPLQQEAPAIDRSGQPRLAEPLAKVEERAQIWTRALTPFLESLGPDAKQRPEPSLVNAIAAGGGLIAFSSLPFFLSGDTFSLGTLAIISGLVIVGSWFLMTRTGERLSFLRPAAVAASLLAIPALAVSLTVDANSIDLDLVTPTIVLAITAAAYLVGWALTGFKGRPTFLAAGLIFLVLTLSSVVADRSSRFRGGSGGLFGFRNPVLSFFEDLEYQLGLQSAFLVIASIILLLVALQLDRSSYFGVATGFVLSGLLTAGAGLAIAAGSSAPFLVNVLIVIAGILACFVGVAGRRRATTWIGATFVVVSATWAIGYVFSPDNPTSIGLVGLIAAAALIAGPTYALKAIKKG
jgi:hypothetical protein